MSAGPVASVIVTNHNYAPWLGEAIDSALAQTHPEVEVVVVDDGSTDDSRDVITSYAGRITTLLQRNAGQASAMNAGFAASHGDPVVFLDADDALYPSAVARAAAPLGADHVSQVHWPHRVIDELSRPTGEMFPHEPLPSGDLRMLAAELGPGAVGTSPTTGNAFPRWVLEEIMPIEPSLRMCADQYVIRLAPLFGPIVSLGEPQSSYRRHAASGYAAASFERQLQLGHDTIEALMDPYWRWCEKLGLPADPTAWRRRSWFHQLHRLMGRLELVGSAPFTLLDEGRTGLTAEPGRMARPFVEREGLWWGAPNNDAEAIQELERQRELGSRYLAVPWFASWWLDYYHEFGVYLRRNYRLIQDDEVLTLFALSA